MSHKVPRLEFDQLDAPLADALRPRVERLEYLGEFFKVMGHNPEVLRPFMAMTEALKAALPDKLTEVGALTVAGALSNDYERHQHERLCEKLRFARSWIAAVNALEPGAASEMSETECLAQSLALDLLRSNWPAAPMLFDDADKEAAEAMRDGVVAKAQRSRKARYTDAIRTTADGLPVPRFRSLLDDLATLGLSTVAAALNTDYTFTVFAGPTSVQQKAFDLLGAKPERTPVTTPPAQ